MINDLIGLLFPQVCSACGNGLLKDEEVLCTHCCVDLPFARYFGQPDNPVSKLLWGRVEFETAGAGFIYKSGSNLQKMIHQLKYRNGKDVGTFLGKLIGIELMTVPFVNDLDVVVPVPLHPSKKRKRGYNQAALIAAGIGEVTGVPVKEDVLKRKGYTKTQTKRNRIDRWQNVDGIFELNNKSVTGQNVLLVDDVITTGATIEACARTLNKAVDTRIHIATVAFSN